MSKEQLKEMLRLCATMGALPDGAKYVPRPKALRETAVHLLEASEEARLMVMGQSGVGKTTELTMLAESLTSPLQTLIPPIATDVQLERVDWLGLLAFTAAWAGGVHWDTVAVKLNCEALEQALRPSKVHDVVEETQFGFGKTRLLTKVVKGGPPEPSVVQRFRNNTAEVQQTIAEGRSQVLDLAVAVLQSLERAKGLKLVLFWDGLEKVRSMPFFNELANHVAQIPFRLVLTAPLSLTFESGFSSIAESIHPMSLRALEPSVDANYVLLEEIAHGRGAVPDVIPEALLGACIFLSGGIPRQLVDLLAKCATQALSDGVSSVNDEVLQRAARRVAERWQYQLDAELQKALQNPNRSKAHAAELLRLGALVEYDKPEGGVRFATNPLVGLALDIDPWPT